MYLMKASALLFVSCVLALASLPVSADTFKEFYDRGRSERDAGNLESAEKLFRKALEKAPDNPDAALFLGLTLNGLGRASESAELLRPFTKRFPDYVGLHLTLVRAVAATGAHQEAESLIADVRRRFPENIAARAVEARVDLYLLRPESADRKYSALLSDAPENRAALVGHVDAALALQDASSAERRLARLRAAFPGDPAVVSREERIANLKRGLAAAEDARINWIAALGYRIGDFDDGIDRHRIVADLVRERPEDIYRLRLESERRSSRTDFIADVFATPWRNEIYVPTLRAGIGQGNGFLPDWRLGAEVDVRVRDADGIFPVTVVDAGVLASGINGGVAERFSLGVKQFLNLGYGTSSGTFRGFLTNDENGGNIFGWVARADWRSPGGWALGAGYGVAPEDSEGATIVIRTLFASAEAPITDDISLVGSLSREEIEDITERYFAGLTLKVVF